MRTSSLLHFTKSRLTPISLEYLGAYKSAWTQENPSQSYLIDKIWYNMIWYDMEQYGMIWYLIGSQLLKLFLSWNEDSRATQLAKYPLNLVLKLGKFPENFQWKYLSFPRPIQGIFCRKIFSSDCNIMRMLFHISPPSLYIYP